MSVIKLLVVLLLSIPIFCHAENLRLTPEQLNQSLADYTILDVRSHLDYLAGHIKGAISFPIDLTYEHKNINGKITEPVKGATLIGDGATALNNIVMVGNDLCLDPGVGTCGKEGQSVPVGVGQPTLKLSELIVGGVKSG